MLITYIDESQRGDQYYFIGALTVTGAALVQVEQSLNAIVEEAATLHPQLDESAELHAREVFQGEGAWEGVPPRIRVRVCQRTLAAVGDSGARFVLRGTDSPALRAKYPLPHPIHELTLSHALEEVNRQILDKHGPDMATLVIADEHHRAEDSRRRFKQIRLLSGDGYSQSPLTQLADVVYFGPSHHSRLLQAADMATFFHNRLRTVPETDARSAAAMTVIKDNLERFTDNNYVWVPKPESTKPPA